MDPTFGPIVEELDLSENAKFWNFDVDILANVLSGLGVEEEKTTNYSSDEEEIVSVRSVRSGLLNFERPLVQSPSQNSMGLTASCASLASSRSSGSISSSWAGSGKSIAPSMKNMNLDYPAPPPALQPHQIPSINRSVSEKIPRTVKVQQPIRANSEQLRHQDRPRPPVPIDTASIKYKTYDSMQSNPASIDLRTTLVDECQDYFQSPIESDLFKIPEPPRPEIQRHESGTRTQKQPRTNENENQLTCLLAYYLQSPIANPYEGSVPVERLQNLMRSRHPELYHSVVGSRHNAWRRFLERHPDVFHLFSPESGKWRMALACNNNWQQGDRRERAALAAKKHHLITCILHFLRTQPSHQCKVDDFMKAYPNLPPNLEHPEAHYPLPARGDLVRFVRSNPFFFRYDPISLSIQLSQRAGI